ncbi:MAG: ATP-binding protein [Rhodobacteraceae bacterium]|nr:ATP-binding protein [Paracoccaceae bacterium]
MFDNHVSFRIRYVENQWKMIDQAMEILSKAEEWSDELEGQIRLIAEELCLNLLNHGANSKVPYFEAEITTSEAEVVFVLSDHGPKFDPLEDAPDPNVDAPLDERELGGLGVHIVRSLADGISYKRDGERNVLRVVMKKGRAGSD